jgi:hypothetical protein
MKKEQLAKRLAQESGISTAAAADQLDGIFAGILKRLRRGHKARLPGLGTFLPGVAPGVPPDFQFDRCLPLGARREKGPAGKRQVGTE